MYHLKGWYRGWNQALSSCFLCQVKGQWIKNRYTGGTLSAPGSNFVLCRYWNTGTELPWEVVRSPWGFPKAFWMWSLAPVLGSLLDQGLGWVDPELPINLSHSVLLGRKQNLLANPVKVKFRVLHWFFIYIISFKMYSFPSFQIKCFWWEDTSCPRSINI